MASSVARSLAFLYDADMTKNTPPHHHQKSDNGSKPLKSEGTIGRLIGLRVTELPG